MQLDSDLERTHGPGYLNKKNKRTNRKDRKDKRDTKPNEQEGVNTMDQNEEDLEYISEANPHNSDPSSASSTAGVPAVAEEEMKEVEKEVVRPMSIKDMILSRPILTPNISFAYNPVRHIAV